MSPTPTNTGSTLARVWKVQVGPVVVRVPSLTVAYHSKVWPAPRLTQVVAVFVPETTPVFCPISVKLPLVGERPTEQGDGSADRCCSDRTPRR